MAPDILNYLMGEVVGGLKGTQRSSRKTRQYRKKQSVVNRTAPSGHELLSYGLNDHKSHKYPTSKECLLCQNLRCSCGEVRRD
jgi:hypothetical protein